MNNLVPVQLPEASLIDLGWNLALGMLLSAITAWHYSDREKESSQTRFRICSACHCIDNFTCYISRKVISRFITWSCRCSFDRAFPNSDQRMRINLYFLRLQLD